MARDPRHRVLFLINDLALGGAQRVLASHALHLDRARFAPEVASLELIAGGAVGHELDQGGIPVHRLRAPGEPAPAALPRLVARLRRGHYPIVHAHLAAADVSAALASCCADVTARVTTFHNVRDWEERSGGALRWLERRTLPRCDRVVVVSGAVERAVLRRLPWLAPRMVRIPNGVDLARVAGARGRRDAARRAFGWPAGTFGIGAVARLEAAKGLDVLLRGAAAAARDLPVLRVVIAGEGAERGRLAALAAELGIAPRVTFTGALEDVRDVLGAIDLFVAPSRTEGLGLALLEALAAGVPVLGARVGGIPEAVEDGGCGELLDGHDPALWSARIVALAGDPARRARYAGAAPAHAARYGLASSVAALQRLYLELLDPAACLEAAA